MNKNNKTNQKQNQKQKSTQQQMPRRRSKTSDKMADFASRFIGSWFYIIFQTVFIFLWVGMNIYGFINHWDPYPFIFLNLALSILSAYAAPVILMTQNREAEKDRIRMINDLATDRRVERAINNMQKNVNRMERKLDEVKRNGN